MNTITMKRKMVALLVRPAIFCAPVLLCLLFLWTGCSKKDDPGTGSAYYMRFKANGKQVEYKTGTQAAFAGNSGLFDCLLAGFSSNSDLGITIFDHEDIRAGMTYDGEILSGTGTPMAAIVYQDEQGNTYSSGNISAYPDAAAEVVLSEIASGYVKGHFSGVVYNDQTKIAITDGEFYLMRAN